MTFYRHSPREKFENPLPSPCRIAVLAPNFAEKEGVRCFEENGLKELALFHPEIVAATVPVLLRLAGSIGVTRAVVAFSGCRIGAVSPRDRDLLWSAYRLPVFEHSFGPGGAILARECEAHDGMHLFAPAQYSGSLRTDPCACGRLEPRISASFPA